MTDHLLLGGPEGPGNQPEPRAAAGRPVTDEEDKALARVARWWPQGLERPDPAPPAVSFSKEAVTAWGPPNPAEAAQALATSYRYCTWRLAQRLDLSLNSAFNLDDITAYIDGPLADSPKSTRKSARTYLRRLDPDRPPAAATPIAIASAARVATSLIPGEEVSGSVADVIDAYVPKTIDPARFERVAYLVRSAVKAWGPKTATRATNALCWAAYLAAWVDANGRPLRPDVVFHPDTVEDYLAMRLAAGADERTMATEATALRGISKALLPTLLASKRTRIAKALYETPYSHSEIGQLFASAASLTTKARRRYGHSLITLGLAVGPFGGEFTGVEPTHVRRLGGQLVVALRGFEHQRSRDVIALPDYLELLEQALSSAIGAGDRYLIGGRKTSRNRLNAVLEDLGSAQWPVPLVHGRLRTTYLVGLAGQRHSVPEILAQAGITTLGALDRVLPFLDAAAANDDDDEQHDDQERHHHTATATATADDDASDDVSDDVEDEEGEEEHDKVHHEEDDEDFDKQNDEEEDHDEHRWGMAS